MKELIKNENGLAMPLVLIILVVITLLGVALWHYGISELNQAVRDEKRSRAYYVARSGAESVARNIMLDMDLLEDILLALDESNDNEIVFNEEEFGTDLFNDEDIVGHVEVKVKRVAEYSMEITGYGTVDGIKQNVSIQLERWEPFDGVVYAMNSPEFEKDVQLIGDVVTAGDSVKFGGNEVENWSDELGAYEHENVDGVIKKDVGIAWPKILFPVPPDEYSGELNVTSNTTLEERTLSGPTHTYEKISIGNHEDLIIDASIGSVLVNVEVFDMARHSKLTLKTSANNDLFIAVDKKFDMSEIVIDGDGVAEIFVRDGGEVEFKTKMSDVSDADDPYLILNLGTGANMQIQAGNPQAKTNFQGLIYGPEATVRLGSNSSFEGSMIVENLWGSGQGKNIEIGGPHTGFDQSRYLWSHLDDYGNYLMVRWLE